MAIVEDYCLVENIDITVDYEILILQEESKSFESGDYDEQGLKTGLWFLYNQSANGHIVNTGFGSYTNGRRTGHWTLIDPNTNEISEVNYGK